MLSGLIANLGGVYREHRFFTSGVTVPSRRRQLPIKAQYGGVAFDLTHIVIGFVSSLPSTANAIAPTSARPRLRRT
jgi:hypothetical protein